jgi:NADH-quinone oxidoreductase subunit L
MAGEQNLDRMSGFRKAMPFTFGCFIVGGLALSGIPPFSGFFSKDEILLLVGDRGGWHWALYVAGYVGAFLTAVYTFRMIFRAFLGEPCAEAKELEAGHLHHAEVHRNPMTGEEEDTDVGFPGPEHHIAERELPMRLAMGTLALLAIGGGALQIPHTTHAIDNFLRPTFEDSTLFERSTSDSLLTVGLVLGAVLGLLGIGLAYLLWVKRPQTVANIRTRLSALHTLFVNKWFFDELLDRAFVRPAAWIGRFFQETFERIFVSGLLVGGTTGIVRAGSAAVRAAQSGFLRYYAALVIVGLTGVSLYFLINAS